MRKLKMQVNISVDGYADHTVAIADNELHEFAAAELENTGTILLGRVTYQLMDYWRHVQEDPDATGSMIEFAEKFNNIPRIIFSRTLEKAAYDNETIIRDDIIGEVRKLKNLPGKDISVGGLSTIRLLMKNGLMDELLFLVQPVIWGSGRLMFEGPSERAGLKLIETKVFNSGVVALRYRMNHL